MQIDETKIDEKSRYDGQGVLRNKIRPSFSAVHAAVDGRGLVPLEQVAIADATDLPKCDKAIPGHVLCTFLALVSRQELEVRLAAVGHDFE